MTEPESVPPPEESEENPAPPRARPDWLVGAEEGVASEWGRTSGGAPERPVSLRLVRPEDVTAPEGESGAAPASGGASLTGGERLHLMGPGDNVGLARPDGKAIPKAGTVRKAAWTAAASSVPTLKRSAPSMPAPQFAQVRDDEEEHEPSHESEPLETSREESEPRAPRQAPVTLAPLQEAWWLVALDALRNSVPIQLGIAAVVLGLLTFTFWPRGETSVSVSRIRSHPEQFDGQMVRVHGKIGDVYAIAGGYTFYLLQGRDTMVVFTRTRVPVQEDNVSIRGTISTGYLDGVPRQALFEDGKK